MLIVRLQINSEQVGYESAQRIQGGTDPKSLNVYELSDGCTIKHRYGDGAAKLAEKMMRHLNKHRGNLRSE